MLNIDIETYCDLDIKKVGVYKYTEHKSFEILMIAYSFGADVKVIDIASGQTIPSVFLKALLNPNEIKVAFNATFERLCLNAFFGLNLSGDHWRCTMIQCFYLGMPFNLDTAAKVLDVEQKDSKGKALINFFCKPCKPTKTNNLRTRNLPQHSPDKWLEFLNYCVQDVVAEMSVGSKISFFKQPAFEYRIWSIDQKINDRGVRIDTSFAKKVIDLNSEYQEKLSKEASLITFLDNPNSVAQLRNWFEDQLGEPLSGVTKETMSLLVNDPVAPIRVKRMAQIRLESAKTSVKKYDAMLNSASDTDGRIRGTLQYYGACRTGRFAGRLVQLHNLPQNHLPNIESVKNLVSTEPLACIELLFGNPPDTFSQLIRTAFIPAQGKKFIVSDFAAIEARVIAWLAEERWRMDVFATHGKIYEASAAAMFHLKLEDVSKDLRQKGKVAELALGYQGGTGALEQMGAIRMGLDPLELPEIVQKWREASPKIVELWRTCNRAAMDAVKHRKVVKIARNIKFFYSNGYLFISLPSSRLLAFPSPEIGQGKFGEELTYMAQDQTTRQWGRKKLYGGLIVENLCQAIARDCLVVAIEKLESRGYSTVLHVHDEVVLEEFEDFGSVEEVEDIMGEAISWGPDLLLKAEGFTSKIYKK